MNKIMHIFIKLHNYSSFKTEIPSVSQGRKPRSNCRSSADGWKMGGRWVEDVEQQATPHRPRTQRSPRHQVRGETLGRSIGPAPALHSAIRFYWKPLQILMIQNGKKCNEIYQKNRNFFLTTTDHHKTI